MGQPDENRNQSDRMQRPRRVEGPVERPTTNEQRIDNFFATNDANDDQLISTNKVSARLWERLAEADLNEDGVSRDELLARQVNTTDTTALLIVTRTSNPVA